jgi:hypothetical protein
MMATGFFCLRSICKNFLVGTWKWDEEKKLTDLSKISKVWMLVHQYPQKCIKESRVDIYELTKQQKNDFLVPCHQEAV